MFSKYFKKLPSNKVQCTLCYRYCVIEENKVGFCKVRKNFSGKLVSLVYNKPISINIDKIEKKPLYHYLPKTSTLSLGTPGCNFDCSFCQNYKVSNCSFVNLELLPEITPEDIVSLALENKTPSISYTYTEPTIFGEYALSIMKLAKENNLKNIWVSNAYFSKELFEDIVPYLDAINIDYKGPQSFYDSLVPGINLSYIKENIQMLYNKGIHLEITNLLLEGYNTSPEAIEELVSFVASLSLDIPLHFSKALPHYRLASLLPTPLSSLKLAKSIAEKKGLKNVYLGNI